MCDWKTGKSEGLFVAAVAGDEDSLGIIFKEALQTATSCNVYRKKLSKDDFLVVATYAAENFTLSVMNGRIESSPGGLLHRCLRSSVADHFREIRRNYRVQGVDIDENSPSDLQDVSDKLANQEFLRKVFLTIEAHPFFQSFRLRLEGFSFLEIATQLGISEACARQQFHRLQLLLLNDSELVAIAREILAGKRPTTSRTKKFDRHKNAFQKKCNDDELPGADILI